MIDKIPDKIPTFKNKEEQYGFFFNTLRNKVNEIVDFINNNFCSRCGKPCGDRCDNCGD